jgi:hypothetical protein
MARMKSIGDMGSPWLRPLSCLMGFLGIPLRRILDDVVDKAKVIHSRHPMPNPKISSTSRRYAHETESKALAMSNLMKNVFIFFL